jgi:hypothetical protein
MTGSKEVVGAKGFEPSTSWSRNKSASSRKTLCPSAHSENAVVRSPTGMCAAVSGCARLIAGSLQKPLQRVGVRSFALYSPKPLETWKSAIQRGKLLGTRLIAKSTHPRGRPGRWNHGKSTVNGMRPNNSASEKRGKARGRHVTGRLDRLWIAGFSDCSRE